MKKSQISKFFDIFQVGVWVALEGSVDLFWVYGNLGDVLGVYIVNSTKFQILPDFRWPEI